MKLEIKDILLCFDRITLSPNAMNFYLNQLKSTARYPYLRRWSSIVQIGNESNYSRSFNFTRSGIGIPRYVFILLREVKTHSAQTNYQLHNHGDIINMKISFGGNMFPSQLYNIDYTKNKYILYYNQFLEVCNSMGYDEAHLSMIEFKNLYPIYAFDLSNLPESIDGGDMTIYIEKSKDNAISYQALIVGLLENIVELNFSERVCKIATGRFNYKK